MKKIKKPYEFNGCYYHGCNRCYNSGDWNNLKYELFGTTYSKHLNRQKKIQHFAVNEKMVLIEMWECDFDRMCKSNKKLNDQMKSRCFKERLNPRNALFGGRTNAFVLYYKVKLNERIKYVDFCSLYPYIQKYGKFPIGHPEVITENFKPIENYFGLIYCKILPPNNLFIPLLPSKINNKLVFALCAACAEQQLDKCNHNDSEKTLEGTWTS